MVAVHAGVYVTRTGPLTWLQRAWAAVLACWPAVLDAESALRAAEGPGRHDLPEGIVRVAVERGRHLDEPDGVRIRRVAELDDLALWQRHPPVLRYEAALLRVADGAPTEMAAVGWLAEACGGRRTTAPRLEEAVAASPRMRRRVLLEQILDDVEAGTCSVLERAYRRRVERAHGLPRGVLQAPARDRAGRPMLRDVLHPRHGLGVELVPCASCGGSSEPGSENPPHFAA